MQAARPRRRFTAASTDPLRIDTPTAETMRENPLWNIWASGGVVFNGWVSVPSGYLAEVVAHQGWDSVTCDMQHGAIDYAASFNTLTAISTTAATPMVRVAGLDDIALMHALDAGAYGVICPLVDTRADAEALVAATSYPPLGRRSHGPMRGLLYGGADYPAHANAAIVRFAMIETADGLANLEAICATPGLTGVYVGPADLGNALGAGPNPIPEARSVKDAIAHIAAVATGAGLIPGIHAGSAEHAHEMIGLGYRFISVGTDIKILAAASRQLVDALRAPGPVMSVKP
jgi:4-hydroxy-2-oxoheptanedioate aldolase